MSLRVDTIIVYVLNTCVLQIHFYLHIAFCTVIYISKIDVAQTGKFSGLNVRILKGDRGGLESWEVSEAKSRLEQDSAKIL